MGRQEVARYPLGALGGRSGRTLLERLTLAAPRLARLVRVMALRLAPTSRIRRVLLAKVLLDVYESYNRRDWEATLAIAHPEFEFHSHPGPYTNFDLEEESRGHQGWLRFMERWFESWDEFRLEPEEAIDFGDRVLVLVKRSGRGRGSGAELDLLCGDLFTLEDGWVVHYDDYWAPEGALKVVGLLEVGDLTRG